MQPDAKVRRKNERAATKGQPTGRRTTHLVETQLPTPGSSWKRRHPTPTPNWQNVGGA